MTDDNITEVREGYGPEDRDESKVDAGYGNTRTCWRCEDKEPVPRGNYCRECQAQILWSVDPNNPHFRPTAEVDLDATVRRRGYWVDDGRGSRYWHGG